MKLPRAPTGEPQTSPESGEVSLVPKTTFSFMNIPAELRIMIYMLHFNRVDDRKWGPAIVGFCVSGDCCPFRRFNDDVPVRMLLMVSRAVYEEAMPLYFRTKKFLFLDNGLSTILGTIGPRQRQHVSKVVFMYGALKTAEDFPLLKDCPALVELTILVDDLPSMKYEDGHRIGLMGLPGLKTLLQIRGIKKLSVAFSEFVKEKTFREEREGLVEVLQVLKEPYANKKRPRGAAWKLAQRS